MSMDEPTSDSGIEPAGAGAVETVRILVVDDEPDLEFLIRRKFRAKVRSGEYEFHFAPNGVAALQVLEANPEIEVVLSDINMPEMDGLTLLLQLAQRELLLKAVVVSAYGDMGNIRKAMNRGAFDFLTKPIDFEDLEKTIVKTVAEVRSMRAALSAETRLRSLENELTIARGIQEAVLPRESGILPWCPSVDVFASAEPASAVGGDFYDFFPLPDGRIAFVIADVSGKSIPAAFFMAVSRTLLRTVASLGAPASQVLAKTNQILALENPRLMFVTLFYGILDPNDGTIEYSNAGHLDPYIVADGKDAVALPAAGGSVLGVFEDAPFEQGTAVLQPGETLVLYTDGVTEAQNAQEEMYGDARLRAFLSAAAAKGPRALLTALSEDVRRFAAGAPQSDDITALAMRWMGPGYPGI